MKDVTANHEKFKASKRPYMRLFTSDYRDGTANLDFETQGFYFRILTYLHDGESVPADPVALARFLQCNARTIRKLLPKLISSGKLFVDGFELNNPRIQRELGVNSIPIQPEFEPKSAPKIQKSESNQEGANTHHRADHFHSHIHSQREEEKTASFTDTPRDGPNGCSELKSVLNGSTETMLEDVQRWLGPLARRSDAVRWLTGTVAAYGASRTAQAWTIVVAKQASGQVVPSPLPFWAKTAGGIKDVSTQQPNARAPGRAQAALDKMLAEASA